MKPPLHDVLDVDGQLWLPCILSLSSLSSTQMAFWEAIPISSIRPQFWVEETPPPAPEVGK